MLIGDVISVSARQRLQGQAPDPGPAPPPATQQSPPLRPRNSRTADSRSRGEICGVFKFLFVFLYMSILVGHPQETADVGEC